MYENDIIEVMEKERDAIDSMLSLVDDDFERAVNCVLLCKGKVVFMGIGKSGHIGEKLAATFASTGTPSFFVNCGEAYHGDFGMLHQDDVVFLISNSGNTAEVVGCLPVIRRIGCPIIAITRDPKSKLAAGCDILCRLPDVEEADHLGIAPTVSSTATLVLGDAIACTVSKRKGFTKEQFHLFHPGGALGEKLKKESI